jgi:hypothetical protein
MTRWLQMAREAVSEPWGQVTEGDTRGQKGLPSPSVPFVTCHQPSKPRNDPAALVLAAVRAGHRRPGPIARAAGLGVTCAYQTIDALHAAGLITQAANGELAACDGSTAT